jgi:SRSO17 transposase
MTRQSRDDIPSQAMARIGDSTSIPLATGAFLLIPALANLPAGMDLCALAATIKARWVCEQAHQQLKEELGLDHFEGRSWAGLHRHALMTMIAYAFLQHRRLTSARRKKKSQRTAASTKLAGRAARHHLALHPIAATTMPALPNMDRNIASAQMNLPK